MQLDIVIDQDNNYVRIDVAGKLDLARLLAEIDKIVDHPDFEPGMDSICNLLNADYQHLRAKDFGANLASNRAAAARRGKAKVVAVVADELGHGLVRMFEPISGIDSLEYHIARSIPEAMAILDIPE